MLCYFRDDAGPACGRVGDVYGAVGKLDDGGGDGGERALEGLYEVCFSWDIAECICCVGDAKVCFRISSRLENLVNGLESESWR
jgi:hypothetical protein